MKKIWAVARGEYLCWLIQPRMLIVGVLLIFMQSLAIEPLMQRADKMGIPMSGLEPFVAVGNSSQLVMLIPFVFLILLSDYPRMSSNSLLQMCRTGRFTWLAGQILFLCLAILTYLCIILAGSLIFAGVNFSSMEWSDAVTKYNSVFPDEYGNFDSMLLPSNLYNQIPLIKAVALTFGYLFLYLMLLSLVMYVFKLTQMPIMGLVCAVFVIACGVLSLALETKLMWVFPMAHTIPWLHYEEILRKPIFPIWLTNVYWVFTIAIGLTSNLIAIKRYNFLNLDTRR